MAYIETRININPISSCIEGKYSQKQNKPLNQDFHLASPDLIKLLESAKNDCFADLNKKKYNLLLTIVQYFQFPDGPRQSEFHIN